MVDEPLWASGPAEILRHGFSLLQNDSDTNRRLAMISIDNSVELMMQTYISLPKRVTGIDVSRKVRDEYCSNFGGLLDGLENHAAERVVGINLGVIEWFHRLRNELYHQGNGLTVEKTKVVAYSEVAEKLYEALFETKLQVETSSSSQKLGQFLAEWISIEKAVVGKNFLRLARVHQYANEILQSDPENAPADMREYSELRDLRNRLVHGEVDPAEVLTDTVLKRVSNLAEKIERLAT